MQVTIFPSKVKGTIVAPASKSCMQRACAAALLHNGITQINNYGISNDDKVALSIIQQLGAKIIEKNKSSLIIDGTQFESTLITDKINCGESGLSCRMFTSIAALKNDAITFIGEGSLCNRPMHFLDEVLPKLGVSFNSKNGFLPITLKGVLKPQNIHINGNQSSQYLSGLLFAFAKIVTEPVQIIVTDLKSKPYIDLTLSVLQHFGYNVVNNNYKSFTIYPKINSSNTKIDYTVEGDWSSASFLLVAGAIAGSITVQGLNAFSTQADKAILQPLMATGASVSIEQNQVTVSMPLLGTQALKPFHFNATDCPDLFPPLVALAAFCQGTSVIEGVQRLLHKESNRALSLQQEFAKFGITITLQDDLMLIKGGEKIIGTNIKTHSDHRIAMACAIAGLGANNHTCIDDAEVVNKSYPNFFTDLNLLICP